MKHSIAEMEAYKRGFDAGVNEEKHRSSMASLSRIEELQETNSKLADDLHCLRRALCHRHNVLMNDFDVALEEARAALRKGYFNAARIGDDIVDQLVAMKEKTS